MSYSMKYSNVGAQSLARTTADTVDYLPRSASRGTRR